MYKLLLPKTKNQKPGEKSSFGGGTMQTRSFRRSFLGVLGLDWFSSWWQWEVCGHYLLFLTRLTPWSPIAARSSRSAARRGSPPARGASRRPVTSSSPLTSAPHSLAAREAQPEGPLLCLLSPLSSSQDVPPLDAELPSGCSN